MIRFRPPHFWIGLALLGLLLPLLYWPGLSAGFVLDDHGSIAPLGHWGRIDSWGEVIAYLETGFRAGPTGRPVAQLSFLLNADTWPTAALPFLATNLAIHLLTCLLLALFLRWLLVGAGISQAGLIALLAAACWALHPLHVSTVLYAVQRMTQLSALFTLLALCCYLPLRLALQQQRLKVAAGWTAALGGASLLALGSKENAILIPQSLLLVEWLLGRNAGERSRPLKSWLLICCWLPSLVVWLYLAYRGLIPTGFERRPFDLGERLLTQIGIWGLYLQHLLLPKVITPGLFYDGYPVVREFLSSPSTQFWAVVHAALLGLAFWGRRSCPLLTFGVLWFYAGHLLEGTTIPLELVFEHRNYLPSAGLALVLAWGLARLTRRAARGYVLTVLVLVLLAVLLQQRAAFWGDPQARAVLWAEQLPESSRAQENAFAVLFAAGNQEAGEYFLWRSVELFPDDPYLKLKTISRVCASRGTMAQLDWDELLKSLRDARLDFRLYELLGDLWQRAQAGDCQALTIEHIESLIAAALDNRRIRHSGIAGHMAQLRGEIRLVQGATDQSLEQFRIARQRVPDPAVAVYQARLLAGQRQFAPALQILDELLANPNAREFLKQQALDVRQQIEEDL
ncbi:hypothetical protein N878_05335 [Pseudomonas sp. EGD-AK9]|uniref:hypothetical protein n=1 Tax=Pseudomonas sp. EGD-AK9 TaxID=1386078 RepID=UPI0003981621|nr:hypothetical protein [Pseudomonas sp. EGD-AK9]ERI52245.1 hypothetical protein N878_05335 [Pseudomonas sp. EGD-AK9]